ncbi:uncharacterized protein LOC121749100 [Salvia splendens]|uniref:uncharacterized protein LOC121749100 n=1 Tax=Salvia splendens TaxID=180675 RepID=UPI001C2666B9|nr:uncharacterized protein LOC121749100 [Salvia splendens]
METNKLNGSNFTDWLRCLQLLLRIDKIEYVLYTPISDIPDKKSPEFASFDKEAYEKHVEDAALAQCIMLSSMNSILQRQYEHMLPYVMIQRLKSLYAPQAPTTEYETLQDLFKCKLHDEGKVSEHALHMIGLIERLTSFGTVLSSNISTNLILESLPSCFENFIINFNMNNMKVGLPELHNMLTTYESSIAKGKSLFMVGSSANSSKWKNEQQKKITSKDIVLKPKGGGVKKKPLLKDECLFCHKKGH